MNIYIPDPLRGQKLVGRLFKRKSGLLFRKNVKRNKHFMDIMSGYGIQKAVFDEYLRGKKGVIQIKETDTGKFLVASIKTWTENSKSGNYGDGAQIFLSERFMHNADNFNRQQISENIMVQDFSMPLSVWQEIKKRNHDLVSRIKST